MVFVACSNGSEESNEVIETTTTTTQETTTTFSTTTTTSLTTTTMVEEEYELDPPKVLITNCPTEDINVDIYELEWTAEAGSGDIVYIGILVEKDDANFTRVFFTKEDNADLITFPTAYTSNSYSYQIDNTDINVAASYIIEINIISEQPNGDQVSTYDLCYADYSPPTTTTSTTTTTTTTTTTVPPSCPTYSPSVQNITNNSGNSFSPGDKLSLTIDFLNGSREVSFINIFLMNNFGDEYILYNWGENDIFIQSSVIEPRHTEFKIGEGQKTLEYTFDSYLNSGDFYIYLILVGDNEYSGGLKTWYAFDESGKLTNIYYQDFALEGCRYASNELRDISSLNFSFNN